MKASTSQVITLALLVALLGSNIYVAFGLWRVIHGQERLVTRPLEDIANEPLPVDFEFHSLKEVHERLAKLADAGARERGITIAEIDSWFITPEDENGVQEELREQRQRLRDSIIAEVHALRQDALRAQSGREGQRLYGEASALIALFPLDPDDETAMTQARDLSASQAWIEARLGEARRLRYNHWATERIAAAIKGYHDNSSAFSPKAENPRLILSLVEELGPVDPMLLEPAVLELYNYVVQITKGDISEADKVDLAKKLTAPTIERKTLEDF